MITELLQAEDAGTARVDVPETDNSIVITLDYIDVGIQNLERAANGLDTREAVGATALVHANIEIVPVGDNLSPGSMMDTDRFDAATGNENIAYDKAAWEQIVAANKEMEKMARVALYPLVNTINLPGIDPAATTMAGLN